MSQEEEKRSMLERKRNLLLLIVQYLDDAGLVNTTEILTKECGLLALNDHVLCDNMDLDTVYLDYMSYHHVKFGRFPRVAKKRDVTDTKTSAKSDDSRNTVVRKRSQLQKCTSLRADVEAAKDNIAQRASCLSESLIVTRCGDTGGKEELLEKSNALMGSMWVLPALRNFEHYTQEWKVLADIVCRDIVLPTKNVTTTWDNVKGLDGVRETLIESVITPLKYPSLFDNNMIRPWKCILLYGPPGTGKTMLSRALCNESCGMATFFNVSVSSIVSKWRGESEKLIRVLFDVAKYYAPSIVFIDEVDGLMSRRDGSIDHEASKRCKNELLTQIDQLEEVNNVFLLASTNLPWEIDPAFMRRFERKILLGLPNLETRTEMIRQLVPAEHPWSSSDLQRMAALTEFFTGDEIRVAFKEASMNQIRQAISSAKTKPVTQLEPISPKHFQTACSHIKPASFHLMDKYTQWNNNNGNPVA